jgi:gliding motility-associated-like protein
VAQLNLTWGPGCSDTLYDTIVVSNLSVSVSAGPDQTLSPGQTANLFATGGLNYFWYSNLPAYFSNQFAQSTSTLPVADTTIFYVEVTDEFGCKGIDSLMVFVIHPPRQGVMNVITPNGDGRNDVLNLTNVTLDEPCRFVVMDRWGKQVYEQNPYTHSWNGVTSGGQQLPDGTYYFILQLNDEILYKGPVTIIRL